MDSKKPQGMHPDAFFGQPAGKDDLFQPGDWRFVVCGLMLVLLGYGVAAWLDERSDTYAQRLRTDAHAAGYADGQAAAQYECKKRVIEAFRAGVSSGLEQQSAPADRPPTQRRQQTL